MEETNKDLNVQSTTSEQKTESVTNVTPKKVFDADYVEELRQEAKSRRLALREKETMLKQLLGVDAETDITDYKKLIEDYNNNLTKREQEIMSKANEKLIKAEVASKSEYNQKLLSKLLDYSKITMGDDGVVGLDEQLIELEKEFPEIKKVITDTGKALNPPPQNTKSYTKAQLNAMSKEEINADWDNIQQQMKDGLIK